MGQASEWQLVHEGRELLHWVVSVCVPGSARRSGCWAPAAGPPGLPSPLPRAAAAAAGAAARCARRPPAGRPLLHAHVMLAPHSTPAALLRQAAVQLILCLRDEAIKRKQSPGRMWPS